MHHFFTTLDEYLMTEVIHTAWHHFKSRLPSLNSFEELVDLHREYLNFMLDKSFLQRGKTSRVVDTLN
jgi:hypothetical protein